MSLLDSLTDGLWQDAQSLLQRNLVSSVFDSVTNRVFQETVYDAVTRVNWRDKLIERGEPLFNIHWSVVMPFGLPPMYVEEINAPIMDTIDTNMIQQGNRKRIDPGFVSIDNLDLTFAESSAGVVMQFIQQWRSLVSYQGFYGRPSDYKKTITVLLHDTKGNVAMVLTYKNCWPISAAPLSLASGSTDYIRLSVQFSVESVRVEVVGQQSPTGAVQDVARSAIGTIQNRLFNNAQNLLSNGIRTVGNSILRSIF